MIGLIIYKVKIYTQAERVVGEDTIKENNLLGKRLGYAKGNIDECYNYLDLPNISDNDIDKFIKELYSGEFVDLTKTNIYDNSSRHLFIYMKDNTRIQLRLFEGGYVGYQDLGWYFVKMPGEIFDKFYEASK